MGWLADGGFRLDDSPLHDGSVWGGNIPLEPGEKAPRKPKPKSRKLTEALRDWVMGRPSGDI